MADEFSFGAWVRRRQLDLTQAALAARIGVAAVTVQKLEADERRPSRQVATLLADALQVPPAEREAFLAAARGERAVDALHVTPAPPSEAGVSTVTFLFTDIQGSTRLWEQHPQAMRAALPRHDALLRGAIERHGGRVFKTVGDAVCASFPDAGAALAASLEGQRALRDEAWAAHGLPGPLVVRMAIATGPAEAHAGDYSGLTLSRVARILSLTHGGQVLLAGGTRALVADHLPPGVSLRDLGTHPLKDLSRPEPIAQAVVPDLPADFPPLRAGRAPADNLPAPLVDLIGREAELAAMDRLLGEARLVTLTGPGGTGKTQLALGAARAAQGRFRDGVWLVDLAPVVDQQLVAEAVAQALQIPESPDATPRDQLLSTVREKQLLLLLDNFEQVVAAAPLVADLLRAAPRVTVLVTSRIPLRVAGERELPVMPLAVREDAEAPALRLFAERARAARPDFTLSETNLAPVLAICRRLDGLPLAIELAAARTRLLSPEALLARIASAGALPALGTGRRDAPARQQTIRATIAWSDNLLSPGARTLLARLAVFSGGWTIEAAEAVCGDEALDVEAGLEELVEQSLVRVGDIEGEARFQMLETIREYALERLGERGEVERFRQRHARWCVALAEHAAPALRGAEQLRWAVLVDREYDNLHAALAWRLGEPAAERDDAGPRLVRALCPYWVLRERYGDWGAWTDACERWVEASLGLALSDLDRAGDAVSQLPPERCAVLAGCTLAQIEHLWIAGAGERAQALVQSAVLLARRSGDPWYIAYAARVAAETEDELREALVLARAAGDLWLVADVLRHLALHFELRDQREALRWGAEAIAVAEKVGDRLALSELWFRRGRALEEAGDLEGCRTSYEAARAYAEAAGNRNSVMFTLLGLGNVAQTLGDYAACEAWTEERLAIARELGNIPMVGNALLFLSVFAREQGDYERAARLAVEGLAVYQEVGNPFFITWARVVSAQVAIDQAQLDEARTLLQGVAPDDLPGGLGHTVLGLLAEADGDYAAAEALYRELITSEDGWHYLNMAVARRQHALCLLAQDRPKEALATLDELAAAAQGRNDGPLLDGEIALANAWVQLALEHHDVAQARLRDALEALCIVPAKLRRAEALECVAELARAGGAPSQATLLLGAAAALREQIGAAIWPVRRPQHDGRIAALRATLSAADFDTAWEAGRATTWQEVAFTALAWLRTQDSPQKQAVDRSADD